MSRRIWTHIGLGFLGIMAVAAAIIYWPRRVDLSHLAQAGDGYNVTILRDTWGVPHIYGVTDADAAYGLAYAHAEDDFLTIQQSAVAARGWLARVYGMDAAPNDYMVALLRIWPTLETRYETDLRPDTRAVLDAYADGLNHYAALHPDEVLLADIFPLRGIDVAAASVHKSPLFFGLDETLGDLFADERQSDVSGKITGWRTFGDYRFGSNTMAVNADRSADGSTMFLVNSHQPWEGPVTWYEAHIHSEEGWNATGGLFPGTPAIIHGHNENLAWAFTVNDPDLTDVYVLTINPDNEYQYWLDGEWRDLEVDRAPITVNLLGNLNITVRREVLWSEFGPVVRQDHGVYAIRYAGAGRPDIFQQFYDINKARSFEEWQTAMFSGAMPTLNVGYADREGNIYYLYNASLPLREPGYDWSLYLPGEDSDLIWTETLAPDQLPQVLNPSSGFVLNANSSPYYTTIGDENPSPEDFDPNFGIESYYTNRALRLLDFFAADESITFDDFLTYKFDLGYHPDSDVAELAQMMMALDVNDPTLVEGQQVVAAWDYQTDRDNRSAALPILTLQFIQDERPEIDTSSLARWSFTEDDVLAGFEQAADSLMEHYGRLDPAWGDVQRLQRGDVDLPVGGGTDILHAAYSSRQDDGSLRAYSGDSYIMVVRWQPDGTLESYSIHQYGSATLDEDSPHYNDQSPLFVERELKEVLFDEASIRANLEAEYRPGEEE